MKFRRGFRRIIESLEKFTPGVGLGNVERGSDAEFAQNGNGLGAARNDFCVLQRGNQVVAGIFCFGNAQDGTRSDAG